MIYMHCVSSIQPSWKGQNNKTKLIWKELPEKFFLIVHYHRCTRLVVILGKVGGN